MGRRLGLGRRARLRRPVLTFVTALVLTAGSAVAAPAALGAPAGSAVLRAPAAATAPTVVAHPGAARPGGDITVVGAGWKPGTLLAILLCGQDAIGGTNSCANASGRAVTTDAAGKFSRRLPVVAPPKPCPCVIHVSTVTGEQLTVDAPFTVTGHPTAPLPAQTGTGRLAVLTARLRGGGGLLTWFGAPAHRTLVFTVGNLGSGAVKDPAFDVGTSHGVYAPQWDRQQWHGTVAPGGKQQISFPVELGSGAHGAYTVQLRYGGKVLVTEPWSVGRPWGVTLFWILLFLVVPAAVFRLGMLLVNRLRPGAGVSVPGGARPAWHPATVLAHLPLPLKSVAPRRRFAGRAPEPSSSSSLPSAAAPLPPSYAPDAGPLPWYTHGAFPAARPGPTASTTPNPPSKGSP
ncbi:hypothetical protein BGM09_00475 [Streptomyces sp. CBMA29]|nr:hypothetical protein [Streptomyces sp. CBMA29]